MSYTESIRAMHAALCDIREMLASLSTDRPLYSTGAVRRAIDAYETASADWHVIAASVAMPQRAYDIVGRWNREIDDYARQASALELDASIYGVYEF